jgi:uracil-DNA glycosylase
MRTVISEKTLRARARLALRAERAFGLESLPIRIDMTPAREEVIQPARVTENRAAVEQPPQQIAAKSTGSAANLFAPKSRAPLTTDQKTTQLKVLDEIEVRACKKCRLCDTRTQTVFGEGNPAAQIMFIGEGPGQTEDETGRPFVGRAGEMLNKWIAAMGLKRESVYIANIVKCRPPGNREPALDEVDTCTPYLERQIDIIQPEVIVTLGRPATQYMLQTKNSMGNMRGQWHDWRGIKLLPTYHPAYVLRSYTEQTRRAVWDDLQKVMTHLGLSAPGRKSS